MLTLNDGRNELWQWDTGRKLTVDADCTQVHFSNKIFGRSIDVDVVDDVAIIPDILLQTDKDLTAWAFVGTAEDGYTKISKTFKVNRRNKPADYVFTQTEQTTIDEIYKIAKSVREDADAGKFDGKPGKDGAKGDKGDKGERGDDGEDGVPIICTASGVVPQITDAANKKILNATVNNDTDVKTIRVFGKNFFHCDYEKLVSNIGITVAWDAENQEFILNGTATAPGDLKIVEPFEIDWVVGKKYAISVRRVSGTATLASGSGNTTYGWGIFQSNAAKYVRGSTGNSSFVENYTFQATAFELDAGKTYIFYFQCWRPGTVFEDYRVKIQIEAGAEVTDWEPYGEESAALDNVQSLTLQKGLNNVAAVPSADISVEYVADTKLYIDNKIAELKIAIISEE